MKEANYQNMVNGSQKWDYGDFNKIANAAPVKIIDIGKENKTHICSTTDLKGTTRFLIFKGSVQVLMGECWYKEMVEM